MEKRTARAIHRPLPLDLLLSATLEKSEEAAWSEIQEHLGEMNPYDFQDLVAGLLRGMGYHVSWVSPPGADKGVDVIAHQDPLGVQGGRIKVQVKRRTDKINVAEIRSFMALLGEDDIGIFVTTVGFTSDAETEARGQEKRRLMLLDSRRLFDLWVEHYKDIPEAPRNQEQGPVVRQSPRPFELLLFASPRSTSAKSA